MRHFIFVYISLFHLIILLHSCIHEKVNKSNHEIEFVRKTETINQNVLCKQLNSPIKILGDSIFLKEKMVVLVTVRSDCSGCREKGYWFISRINNIYKKKIAFIVGTGLSENFEKQYNGLIGKIYQDEKALVKQELNLFHTPSIVLLDKNGIVDRILSIFPNDDVIEYDENEKFDEFLEALFAL